MPAGIPIPGGEAVGTANFFSNEIIALVASTELAIPDVLCSSFIKGPVRVRVCCFTA